MANLKSSEKLKLENYLEMKTGYVCDFSNRTYEAAEDKESLGWLNVTRSVWRNTVCDLKNCEIKSSGSGHSTTRSAS
jgi:hypothetical protein